LRLGGSGRTASSFPAAPLPAVTACAADLDVDEIDWPLHRNACGDRRPQEQEEKGVRRQRDGQRRNE
jgi:hypothetical protein